MYVQVQSVTLVHHGHLAHHSEKNISSNRHYSELQCKNNNLKSIDHEEDLIHSNFYDFARRLVKEVPYKDMANPEFEAVSTNKYYIGKCLAYLIFDPARPYWFPNIHIPYTKIDFDLAHIRPKHIKYIICHKSFNKAPGPDCITYGLLKKKLYESLLWDIGDVGYKVTFFVSEVASHGIYISEKKNISDLKSIYNKLLRKDLTNLKLVKQAMDSSFSGFYC